MKLPIDTRVVVLRTSSFVGKLGTVTKAEPLEVLLDGERLPMAFATYEVVRAEESAVHMGGAE